MGDWDYINEHLGGHDSDGMPNFMNQPGFDDDSYFDDDKYIKNEKDQAIEDGKIVVIDGLMYQNIDVNSIGTMHHEKAINYSKNLRLGGMDGWRLPTREELHKIANIELYGKRDDNYTKWFNENKDKRVKNSKGFEYFIKEEFKENFGDYGWYCTSEKYDLSSWLHVSFDDGRDSSSDAGTDSWVLCVRDNTIHANSKIDKDNSVNIPKYKNVEATANSIDINLTPSKYLTYEAQILRNRLINNELSYSERNLKVIHNLENTHDSLALEVYNNNLKIGHIQKYDNPIDINQFCFVDNKKVDNLKLEWIDNKFKLSKDISSEEKISEIDDIIKDEYSHFRGQPPPIIPTDNSLSIILFIVGVIMLSVPIIGVPILIWAWYEWES